MLYFIIIFCIAITVIAIGSSWKINSNLRKIKNNEAKEIAKEIADKIGQIKDLETINIFMKEKDYLLKNEWKKYYNQISNQKNPKQILSPDYYLNSKDIILKYSNRKLANSMPSILTGIGIFGTFLGLVIGLWSLDDLNHMQLVEQIPHLIDGMKLSFISSLVAIVCSLCWTYLDKRLLYSVEQGIEKINEELHRVLPIREESNLLDEIVSNQQEQIRTTKEFVSDTLIPEIVNGLEQAVNKSITPEINKMSNTVDKLASVSMEHQNKNIELIVNKLMDTFNQSFDNQFNSLRITLEEVIDWQKKTKDETEKLINTISLGAERQNDLLNSTESLLKNTQEYIKEFDILNKNLNENISKLSTVGEDLSNLEEQTNQKLQTLISNQEKFNKMKTEHTNELGQLLENIDQYWISIRDNFNGLNKNLTGAMEQFSENTHKGLNRTFEIFDDNLAEISNRLGVTINELDEMLEDIPNSFAKLSKLLEELNLDREEILSKFEEQKVIMRSEKDKVKKEVIDELNELLNQHIEKLDDNNKERVEYLENKIKDIKKLINNNLSEEDIKDLELELSNLKEVSANTNQKLDEYLEKNSGGFFSKFGG